MQSPNKNVRVKKTMKRSRLIRRIFFIGAALLLLSTLVWIAALADTTPQTLPFQQYWTNTGLITADDNWSGVPGVIGYRGDNLTASTGTDPQTILVDGSSTPVDVNANHNDPDTFITGGVTEFELADPTIALQGSGTADAPHIVITLNTTGQSNINVSYNLRDIDGSTDDAVQAVALQYRVGTTGNYTNIPAGFVADATTGSAATLVTPVSVTLPAACNNQPVVQLRIMTTNAVGNDEWVGIDHIDVTAGGGGGTPTLNINDVAQAEGNGGTTTFTFTVSLTQAAGPGGVSFTVNTQDGTATTADNDYVAIVNGSGSIAQGNTSTTVNVTVNGDTTTEPNETFLVNITNITGANAGDTSGQGTINNDDVSLTSIHTIQGNGNSSPFAGSSVTTSGIVTGRRSNGFFLQTPSTDADPNTSEGIFVFTSSAPPATAAVGNDVQVTGTVSEFIPASDTASPPQTELTSPTVSVNSTGNSLPAPVTLTAADTLVNNINNLEKYEGMRVHVDSLTVVAPTGGSIDEENARSSSFGDFYGVITGVARPFREPGIETPYPVPTPWPSGAAPASIQVFDANPERLRINSLGLVGSTDLQVATGAVVTGITGPLDYGFRTYTIDTDPPAVTPTPLVSGGMSAAVPAPTPTARELTIASYNLQRFYDTTDDPSTSDAVLCSPGDPRPICTNPNAFPDRLNKASLAIRNVLNLPDVLGVEEMENLTTLQALATKINNDEVAAGHSNPNYTASLSEGNDVGGIDVGFLVKTSRVNVFSVTQYNKNETFNNPSGGPADILNDRPPLVLRASITQPNGSTLFFSVVVNHLRSLGSVTLQTNAGAHTRVKRQKEAESLAKLINSMQNGGPEQVLPYDQNIVSVGDYNAFQFNDGYNDVIGTIKGTPAPSNQVVESSPDLNNPDLTDLIDLLPADQKYSYTFGGNAQAIDHTLVNPNMLGRFSRFVYPRVDADFPDSLRNDPNRPERISDHDPQVAYFNMAIVPTAAPAQISGRVTAGDGTPLAGVTMTLGGAKAAKTVTDSLGNYRFTNVPTDGLYSVTPSRANYSFTPESRSFSLLADKTDAVFSANAQAPTANPLDDASFFVRQQYVDFLDREPDQGGFDYWNSQIEQCNGDAGCLNERRIGISAAFFMEHEFQQTGSFVYGLYKASYGRRPTFAEFMPDRSNVVGGASLEQSKQAFASSWVNRPAFKQEYPEGMTSEQFVGKLFDNAGLASNLSERQAQIAAMQAGRTRAEVLSSIIDLPEFREREYNAAFVLVEYFGYLRRDPDSAGFDFWLNVLNNREPNNYRGMVCSFITSREYQERFSPVATRSNGDCAP